MTKINCAHCGKVTDETDFYNDAQDNFFCSTECKELFLIARIQSLENIAKKVLEMFQLARKRIESLERRMNSYDQGDK